MRERGRDRERGRERGEETIRDRQRARGGGAKLEEELMLHYCGIRRGNKDQQGQKNTCLD